VQQVASGLASLLGGMVISEIPGTHILRNYDEVGWITIGFSALSILIVRFLKVRS